MQDFSRSRTPPGAFFDSGFSTIDSVLALALLHGLQNKNECRVAIVTISRPNLAVAGFIDAVERYYRGPAGNFAQVPPVGMRTAGSAGETSPAFTQPFKNIKPDGSPAYTNRVRTPIDTGDPVTLIRNYLEAQYDQNAFFVLGGEATNLAAALEFRGVKESIAAKIKYLVIVAGPVSNTAADIPALRKVLADWPTPIITSGTEAALEFPGSSIEKDFAQDSPVADAYRAYQPMPYNAPSHALAAALYAGRPKEGYFKLSAPGTISVHADGQTSFAPSEKGRHQYLIADPSQKEKVLAACIELASTKPAARRIRPDPAGASEPGAKELP
jgi:hypothetical protein